MLKVRIFSYQHYIFHPVITIKVLALQEDSVQLPKFRLTVTNAANSDLRVCNMVALCHAPNSVKVNVVVWKWYFLLLDQKF